MIDIYVLVGKQIVHQSHIGDRAHMAWMYHLMPALVVYTDGKSDIGRWSYLGWKKLPKSRMPKELLSLRLLLGVS